LGLDWQPQARIAIEASQVISGAQSLDELRAKFPSRESRTEALEMLSEWVSDARAVDAKQVLRELGPLYTQRDANERDPSLRELVFQQVQRGFMDDALTTARSMTDTGELIAAYNAIGEAMAKRGDIRSTKAVFTEAERQALKSGLDADRQADLAAGMAQAGLLDEAFAQLQLMSRRPAHEYWYDAGLDAVFKGVHEGGAGDPSLPNGRSAFGASKGQSALFPGHRERDRREMTRGSARLMSL
jgi:hypothetical protein